METHKGDVPVRDIDLKTLRLVVAVCEHKNMARAARDEHIEPSAVSKRIAQLESDLGVPLFTRSRRGVLPTPAGLALLEHARNVLFTMDRIASDVAAFGSGLRGSVSVCASASAIAESLLDDVASFMSMPAHENIRVHVEEWLSYDLVRRLREGVASVGVCWDNVDLEGPEHRPYREDRLALAVHPGHPLAGRSTLRFNETLGYEHVGLPPSTGRAHDAAARRRACRVYGDVQRSGIELRRSVSRGCREARHQRDSAGGGRYLRAHSRRARHSADG
jgi:DNA-binding transcriptional LysR family regulator